MIRLLLLLALALTPVGCERVSAERAGSLIAAKVNGVAISIQELRGARPSTLTQALDKVIDRELLVQQALHDGLDRDPRVVEAVEEARRKVLAEAWLDRQAAQAPRKDEVRSFYSENPALFAERRIYRLTLSQPAEVLPLVWLPRLARMKPGESAAFPSALGVAQVELVQVEEAPLAEAQAAPLIEQFLAGKKRLEVAAAEVKRLRETARIEYIGEFKAR